ncbi:MAG TPA: glycosyltransferase family 4 protein [Gammaproteobacteria bacterium]|jgi:glycosyltransferase involved in cell wall biosynthesis|nr:glycosyltransferase family 4 protein [Gammaproteobacteria bacterium]
MRIAFTSTFDSQDVHNWSGTPYHMSHALANEGINIDFVGKLKRKLPRFFKLKQTLKHYLSDQRESPRFNVFAAQKYSEQAAQKISSLSVDAVISPLINPIAYLDCKQPLVLWTDALYASLIGFYPPFSKHSSSTIMQGNEITRACLSRVNLAVFCSDWAANSAREIYGMSREKVKVVPFGANIESWPTPAEISSIISHRSQNKIKLLFLAKSWERKGGNLVLAVAKALHEAGYPVELSIIGYHPPGMTTPPSYVKCLGYISKHTPEGRHRIQNALSDSHFLFVPSRAEAYGIVFCEANAFALPCLTTHVGGISTIVKDNVNGMTFGLDATVQTYCDYIINVMNDRKRYEEMAAASYNEFTTRLNWRSAAQHVKKLIQEI